jgi:hypothetical protein
MIDFSLRLGECAGYHRQVRRVERVGNLQQLAADINREVARVPLRLDIPNVTMGEWSGRSTKRIAYAEGDDGNGWFGLASVQHVTAQPGVKAIQPNVADAQIVAETKRQDTDGENGVVVMATGMKSADGSGVAAVANSGHGSLAAMVTLRGALYKQIFLDPVRGIRQLEESLRNVVKSRDGADAARANFTLEINAKSARFADRVLRAVGENVDQLGADNQGFE